MAAFQLLASVTLSVVLKHFVICLWRYILHDNLGLREIELTATGDAVRCMAVIGVC